MSNDAIKFETDNPAPETVQGDSLDNNRTGQKGERQRAEKRYLCEAVRAIFPESGRVDAGQLVKLTDAEIWHYGSAVRRVKGDSDPQ